MTCVIIDHTRIKSLLSWFSYQRFWTVTSAEVFVVLSGIVIGMVYGRKLLCGDWRGVVRGLGRRALTLYIAFVGVTLSVLLISLMGIDVSAITSWGDEEPGTYHSVFDAPAINAGVLARVALMRDGPWPFTIVGLYVWLVAAAIPGLLALRFAGWRRLLAVSWALYVVYRFAPRAITTGAFEETFPLMAWQLLFVHGLVIGYHRHQVSAFATRVPRLVPIVVGATVAFAILAMCNPWTNGPSALWWSVVPPDHFVELYYRYFTLPDLGIGRVLNLAVALPVAYAVITWFWGMFRPLGIVFVTLGQKSLGAFVLHVYGILWLSRISPGEHVVWTGAGLQILVVAGIAGLLSVGGRMRLRRPPMLAVQSRPMPA